MRVYDEFREYVRPIVNPWLSRFCKDLAGITQEQVDAAGTFFRVLARAVEWLKRRGLVGCRGAAGCARSVPRAGGAKGPLTLGLWQIF